MKRTIIITLVLICTKSVKGQELHIYGGKSHKVYLGCLTCSSYDSNSIWNEYGTYGNNYSSTSIWNDVGTYGDEYSSLSPWNEHASYPPAIVDKQGNFYGYLTTNQFKSKRAEFNLALTLYKYHDLIKDDVNGWYEKIF